MVCIISRSSLSTTSPTTTATTTISSPTITTTTSDRGTATLATISVCGVLTIAALGFVLWLNSIEHNNSSRRQACSSLHKILPISSLTTKGESRYYSQWYRRPRLLSTLSVINEEEDDDDDYSDEYSQDASTTSSELF